MIADPVRSAPAFIDTVVTPYFLREDWLISAVAQIAEISQLPEDWNSYQSARLTPEAQEMAFELALNFSHQGLPEPIIAPVAGGGLQFSWSLGLRSLEFEILPDGSIEFLRVYGDDTMREGRISAIPTEHLKEQVRWLTQHA